MPADLFDVLRGAASAAPFVRIIHPGDPVPWSRAGTTIGWAHGKPFVRHYTPTDMRTYQEAIAWRAKSAMAGRPPLIGALAIRCFAMVEIPKSWSRRDRDAALHASSRPDWDNYAKTICDACNKIVYKDDAQIVRALTIKEYAERPGIIFEVYEL